MEFAVNRFKNILIKDSVEFGIGHMVQLAIMALIIPLLTLVTVSHTLTIDPSFWFLIAIVIGFSISANMVHSEIHTVRRNSFLMVPASMFEKLLSRFLIVSIGLVAAMALACAIGWLLARGLNELLYRRTLYLREDWPITALNFIKQYLVLQPVFVLAGLQFKRKPILKLILAVLALLFIGMIITATFSAALMQSLSSDPASFNTLMAGLQNNSSAIGTVFKYFYWFGLAPALWVVVFIRLSRFES